MREKPDFYTVFPSPGNSRQIPLNEYMLTCRGCIVRNLRMPNNQGVLHPRDAAPQKHDRLFA